MREFKLVLTGTMGAGKTMAIASVSDTAPIVTDVASSDLSSSKLTTTVGLDFGTLTLDNGDRLRLFGTPGQARFDFLWKLLARGALGLIILVDNSRPRPLEDLQVYLDGFADELAHLPCTIGVGRLDTHPVPPLSAFSEALALRNHVFPVLEVDVRRRADVLLLIDSLLAQVEADLVDMHG